MTSLPSLMRRLLIVVAALLVLNVQTFRVSFSAEQDTKSVSDEVQETARLITAELPRWKLWKGADHERELKLEPKAILRWTNPVDRGTYPGKIQDPYRVMSVPETR